jgi:hypothetical protein
MQRPAREAAFWARWRPRTPVERIAVTTNDGRPRCGRAPRARLTAPLTAGGALRVLVKRDDTLHPALPGNKGRKLLGLLRTPAERVDRVLSWGGSVRVASWCPERCSVCAATSPTRWSRWPPRAPQRAGASTTGCGALACRRRVAPTPSQHTSGSDCPAIRGRTGEQLRRRAAYGHAACVCAFISPRTRLDCTRRTLRT